MLNLSHSLIVRSSLFHLVLAVALCEKGVLMTLREWVKNPHVEKCALSIPSILIIMYLYIGRARPLTPPVAPPSTFFIPSVTLCLSPFLFASSGYFFFSSLSLICICHARPNYSYPSFFVAISTVVYCAAGSGLYINGHVTTLVSRWHRRLAESASLSFRRESKVAITHELNVFS